MLEPVTVSRAPLEERVHQLELLHRVGVALSAERNRDRLVEMILIEAKKLCHADGGTLYLRTEGEHLRFAILRTDSLGLALGGTTGEPVDLPPIPLYDPTTGAPNRNNVASHAVFLRESVNVADAYAEVDYDFSGTKAFDERNDYRSTSLLTIPLVNNEDRVIGVLQLLNAKNPHTGTIVPFREDQQRIVEALASQAAIAIDNQQLLEGQRELLESFIQMIAAAIDSKSPYTGSHCERVPVLTEMLTQAACEVEEGPLAAFQLNEEQWYELRIAAWLHDCGKVTTPVHVMDKATKLEGIYDRIAWVRTRFEILIRDARIAHLEGRLDDAEYERTTQTLREELALVERSNQGGEFLASEVKARLREIGARRFEANGQSHALLDDEELHALSVSRGTLTPEERIVINRHMVETIRMLEALPFPRNLRRVPEYAGGHHETMDGTGYPRGVFAGDMSVPARIMAIADVFEALTALDRPYKKGKALSETMRIMGKMKEHNHLDPDLFDLFITSGVYRAYAERYLPAELIDDVDEDALLSIQARPFKLPAADERQERWKDFLPAYRES